MATTLKNMSLTTDDILVTNDILVVSAILVVIQMMVRKIYKVKH